MKEHNLESPTCISVLVCDEVYRDALTHKQIAVGIFNRIQTSQFPCKHHKLSILFTLTNGRGQYDLALSIENARTGEPVVEISGPLKLESPVVIADFNVEIPGVTFPEPGKYWVCVKIGMETLCQRPFRVEKLKNPRGS